MVPQVGMPLKRPAACVRSAVACGGLRSLVQARHRGGTLLGAPFWEGRVKGKGPLGGGGGGGGGASSAEGPALSGGRGEGGGGCRAHPLAQQAAQRVFGGAQAVVHVLGKRAREMQEEEGPAVAWLCKRGPGCLQERMQPGEARAHPPTPAVPWSLGPACIQPRLHSVVATQQRCSTTDAPHLHFGADVLCRAHAGGQQLVAVVQHLCKQSGGRAPGAGSCCCGIEG